MAQGEKLVKGVVKALDHHPPLGLEGGHRPPVGLVGLHAVGNALLRGRNPQKIIELLARPPLVLHKLLEEDEVLVGKGGVLPDHIRIIALGEAEVLHPLFPDLLPLFRVPQHAFAVAVEGGGVAVCNVVGDDLPRQKAQGAEEFEGGPGPVHRVAHHEKQLGVVVKIPGQHAGAAVESQPRVDLPHQPGVVGGDVAEVAPGVVAPPPGPVEDVVGGHPVEHGLLHIPGQGDIRVGGQQVKEGGGAALLKADAHKAGHPTVARPHQS